MNSGWEVVHGAVGDFKKFSGKKGDHESKRLQDPSCYIRVDPKFLRHAGKIQGSKANCQLEGLHLLR